MKKIIKVFAVLLISTSVFAQGNQEPVKIVASTSISIDTITIVLDFKVADDWIVYDSLGGDVGPIPLSFNFDGLNGLELIGINKPKTKHKFDDIFEVNLWYFRKEAQYELKFKVTSSDTYYGSVSAEYMSCNLNSGVCLPPQIFEFGVSK